MELENTKKSHKKKFIKTSVRHRSAGIVINLGELLKIPMKQSDVRYALQHHEDYPSMLSISDVLSDYGIKNSGIAIDPTPFRDLFKEQPYPMVCILDIEKVEGICVIVTAITGDTIEYLDPAIGYFTEDIYFFYGKYVSCALLIDEVTMTEHNVMVRPWYKKVLPFMFGK